MKNTLYLLKNATSVQMQSFNVTDESGKLLVIDGGNTGDPCHDDHLNAFLSWWKTTRVLLPSMPFTGLSPRFNTLLAVGTTQAKH